MMHKRLCAAGMALLMAACFNVPVGATAADDYEEYSIDVANNEKEKPSDEEREKRIARMEASMKKWESLSKEQKAEVYKLLEEEQSVNDKILDKMVALGVLDKEDAAEMKANIKDCLTKMKEEGRYPFGRPRPKKENKCKSN